MKNRRKQAKRAGFTLVEMMIATTILGVGLLGVAMMQLHALQQGSQGRHTSDAAAVGRTFIEQAHRLPWSELTTATALGTWTDPVWEGASNSVAVKLDQPGVGNGQTVKDYAVQWKVTDVAGNTCLRDVEVSIQWTEEKFDSPRTLTLSTRRYNWGGASC